MNVFVTLFLTASRHVSHDTFHDLHPPNSHQCCVREPGLKSLYLVSPHSLVPVSPTTVRISFTVPDILFIDVIVVIFGVSSWHLC